MIDDRELADLEGFGPGCVVGDPCADSDLSVGSGQPLRRRVDARATVIEHVQVHWIGGDQANRAIEAAVHKEIAR